MQFINITTESDGVDGETAEPSLKKETQSLRGATTARDKLLRRDLTVV